MPRKRTRAENSVRLISAWGTFNNWEMDSDEYPSTSRRRKASRSKAGSSRIASSISVRRTFRPVISADEETGAAVPGLRRKWERSPAIKALSMVPQSGLGCARKALTNVSASSCSASNSLPIMWKANENTRWRWLSYISRRACSTERSSAWALTILGVLSPRIPRMLIVKNALPNGYKTGQIYYLRRFLGLRIGEAGFYFECFDAIF